MLDLTYPEDDFLGFDPPPVTAYSGISGMMYCISFIVMFVLHLIILIILKINVSTDFQNLNLLEKLLHAAQSTNFPFSVNDWDVLTRNGPNEHYVKMKENEFEVIWNIVINVVFNCFLVAPMVYLCKLEIQN